MEIGTGLEGICTIFDPNDWGYTITGHLLELTWSNQITKPY